MPEIRFGGFAQDWEQRKLSDISIRVRGNDGRMDLPTLTISASVGWLDQRDRFSGNIAGKEQKNYTLLSKGHLSYNHGNSKLAKYGVVFELTTYEEALVPRIYHSFKTTIEASATFIEYMFATKIPDRELAKLVSSGARMDGLLNINYDEFMGIDINIPKIKEQNQIGDFLKNLDDIIALQEQELITLQQTKQGFLQKMFPKEEESVPEIRFPGFTEDWAKRKLGNTDTFFTDGNYGEAYPSEKDKSDSSNGVPFLRGSDLKNGFLDVSNSNYITKEKHRELTSGHLEFDDIVIAVRGSVGVLGYVKKENFGWNINSQLGIIRTDKKELLGGFLSQYLLGNIGQKELLSRTTGTALKQLPIKQLKDVPIPIPSINEQAKIGNFFKHLDDTIALHRQELDVLQETKKAFLQKMFV
ncbi:restriction endonuclease subunit S [Sporosarcina sp. FSL K6-5500]